jgi:hypothetical protein
MKKQATNEGCRIFAHGNAAAASLPVSINMKRSTMTKRFSGRRSRLFAGLACFWLFAGCGQSNPTATPAGKPAAEETKPAAPAVPAEIQTAAESLLGVETTVLVFGDLAKNGKQQFLAANVVPKTPKNNLPGTIVTRAVVAENHNGHWMEVLRCDEHLKNSKGYLGLTPTAEVTGWRLQYEQDPDKGLQLYFTPVKGMEDPHVLPIGVRWNPATKRYQSVDSSYQRFLVEVANIGETPRSVLR